MIKCSICKKQTNSKKPTGSYNVIIYRNPVKKSEGTTLKSSVRTCMICNKEVLLK